MDPIKAKDTPERDDTDESLRNERSKSDSEAARHNGHAERVADAVIEEARVAADKVLIAARDGQEQLEELDRHETLLRSREDNKIEQERSAADALLADERRERTRALAALFALERETTDAHLLAERNRADIALSNRDDFLGMVAHDLRGFMGEIALRAELLIRGAAADEAGSRARDAGERIRRSTAGMRRLVGDLLDVAAVEAGKLHVEVSRGDVADVLRAAADPFRSAAEAKGIALELEEQQVSVTALFDHDRVVQVLGNLVSNSIKFTPRGGRILLRLEVVGEEVHLTVKDNGAGIPADKLESIFERFTQLLRTDRRGLGLGLYIARCLVDAQRGRIWAESAPGEGTTLTFTLPLAR